MLSSILTGVLGGFAWSLAPQQWSWLGPLSGGALILGAVGYLNDLQQTSWSSMGLGGLGMETDYPLGRPGSVNAL